MLRASGHELHDVRLEEILGRVVVAMLVLDAFEDREVALRTEMHLEASEVINRIPTDEQVERFLKPMARGKVFATVAGSETWTADNNWTLTGLNSSQ